MEKKILYRFFEGKASYKEEEEVCNWTEASEKNMQEYLKERKYFDMLLVQNRKNDISPTSSLNAYRLNHVIKYAAVIAIFIICGIQIYLLTKPETDQEMNTISVPAGQRVNIQLSDGTSVWLNSGSKMKYPASFTKGKEKRVVTLDGEGYFEVTKDTKRPFVVQTSKYDIEVLGTKFNVDAYDNASSFSAALMEGSIQILDKTEPTHKHKIVLTPLHKAEYMNNRLIVEKIQNFDTYRWKEGLLCFERIAFNDLMKEFEKTYNIQIVNENKSLDNYICSGKFRISDGLDYILHVLQRDVSFHFNRNENNTIIYIKDK